MDALRAQPRPALAPANVRRGAALERIALVALLLLCGWMFFFQLGASGLWDPDEGIHAATSRAMVESGDWILPTFNGAPFLDKPVFHNWLVSGAFLALGFTELAARLPSALMGTALVLVTYFAGRRMFGLAGGFLGAAVLATSALFVVMSRVVVHDISLAAFVTLALALFHAAYRAERPSGWLCAGFWAAVGFAFLAKGPIGPVLVALPIAVLTYRDGRLRCLRSLRPLPGLALALAIALPWNLAMLLRDENYGPHFFYEKNVLGFLTGQAGHREPSLFYVPVILLGSLPWTGFLFLAADRAWRVPDSSKRADLAFLGAWSLCVLVLFSAAAAKLPTYVAPALPPLALLIGWCWSEALRDPPAWRQAIGYAAAPPALLFAAAAAVLWLAPPVHALGRIGLAPRECAWVATGAAAWAALAWGAASRGALRAAFASQVALSLGLLVAFTLVLAPRIEPYRSSRELALALDRVLLPGAPLAMWRGMRGSAVFYADRHLDELVPQFRFESFVRSPERVYMLVDCDDLDELAAQAPDLFVVAEEGATCVVSNRGGALDAEERPAPRVVRLGERHAAAAQGAVAHGPAPEL